MSDRTEARRLLLEATSHDTATRLAALNDLEALIDRITTPEDTTQAAPSGSVEEAQELLDRLAWEMSERGFCNIESEEHDLLTSVVAALATLRNALSQPSEDTTDEAVEEALNDERLDRWLRFFTNRDEKGSATDNCNETCEDCEFDHDPCWLGDDRIVTLIKELQAARSKAATLHDEVARRDEVMEAADKLAYDYSALLIIAHKTDPGFLKMYLASRASLDSETEVE